MLQERKWKLKLEKKLRKHKGCSAFIGDDMEWTEGREKKAQDLLRIPDSLLGYASTIALVKQVAAKQHLNSMCPLSQELLQAMKVATSSQWSHSPNTFHVLPCASVVTRLPEEARNLLSFTYCKMKNKRELWESTQSLTRWKFSDHRAPTTGIPKVYLAKGMGGSSGQHPVTKGNFLSSPLLPAGKISQVYSAVSCQKEQQVEHSSEHAKHTQIS